MNFHRGTPLPDHAREDSMLVSIGRRVTGMTIEDLQEEFGLNWEETLEHVQRLQDAGYIVGADRVVITDAGIAKAREILS